MENDNLLLLNCDLLIKCSRAHQENHLLLRDSSEEVETGVTILGQGGCCEAPAVEKVPDGRTLVPKSPRAAVGPSGIPETTPFQGLTVENPTGAADNS